jgi:hypothetical protein
MTYQENFPSSDKCALRLSVQETGSLRLDPHLLCPFVRIHVVDMRTCKYLAKK